MQDLVAWLAEIGLEQYSSIFLDDDIDLHILPEITDLDLKELGISIGHRRKILAAARKLADDGEGETRRDNRRPETSSADRDNAEHRQLTVLFCDLAGSTELSQTLNSEDLREVVLAYQGACKQAIENHQGFIARYMGDGVLVYFGYPRAHEDDAQLAIRAGLEIVSSVKSLNNDIGEKKGALLAVRVGIATGPVIVGDLIGEGASRESAVVGETPNLAARLQGIADTDNVVISPSTRRLSRGLFQCESLGKQNLKGLSEPVEAWRVVSETLTDSVFESGNKETLTPLVGREEELAILLRRWEISKQGRGQAVFITGEPGIGKSRIVQAVKEKVASDSMVHVRYQCSQHHTNSPLYPILSHFEFVAGILRTDSSDQKLDKLRDLLDTLGDHDDMHVSLLAALLSIPLNERYKPFQGDPRQERQAVLEMLQNQFTLLSLSQPILCIFEDIHWIDPSTMEAIDRLLERIGNMPVLLVLTYRESFECPWTGLPQTTLMSLNRIGRDETLTIIEKLSIRHGLSERLVEHILSRTDGVPLFVEEMTKMLLEGEYDLPEVDGSATGNPELAMRPPETLQDSLTARLDRLGSAKSVAQVCAVIGRSVNYELLEKVIDLPAEKLDSELKQLVAAELMSSRGAPPHAEFTFKHALIQDTAYQSMLRSRRSDIHSRIADALNAHFPADVDQHPEILANHYLLAGRQQPALDYFEKAAKRMLGQSNYKEGAHCLSQALKIIAAEPESDERNEKEIRVQTAMGGAMIATKGFAHAETGAAYTRAAELVRQSDGDTSRFNPVRYGVWVFNLVRGRLDLAHELAEDFVNAADSQENPTERLVAYRTMGSCLTFMGRWQTAVEYLEKALALYDIEKHKSLAVTYTTDPRISTLTLYSWSLFHLGRIDEAIKASDMAVAEATSFGHLHTTAYTLGLSGTMFHQFRGDIQRTREGADALVELCSKQPVPLWTNLAFCLQGWATGMEGDIETGIRQLEKGYNGFAGTGAQLFMAYYCILKAEIYLKDANTDLVMECLEQAKQIHHSTREGWFDANIHRACGDLFSKTGMTEQAILEYQSGQEIAEAHADQINLLRCKMGLAELRDAGLDKQSNRSELNRIYSNFSQGHDSADLVRARLILETS